MRITYDMYVCKYTHICIVPHTYMYSNYIEVYRNYISTYVNIITYNMSCLSTYHFLIYRLLLIDKGRCDQDTT